MNGGVRLEDTKVGFKHDFFFKRISSVSAFVVCRPPGVLLSKQELPPVVLLARRPYQCGQKKPKNTEVRA